VKANHPYDPIDHHHTTHTHTGVAFKSMLALPLLILVASGVVMAVCALASAGYMQPRSAALLGAVAVIVGIIGMAIAVLEHRRVRRVEARWIAEHPDKPTA
jgi:hypothetical protein